MEDSLRQVDQNIAICQEEGRELALAQALAQGMSLTRNRLQLSVQTAELAVEQTRSLFNEHRQNRRVLGNLRDRRHQAWRQEVEAEMQAEFDELARVRFTVKKVSRR